MGETRTDLGNNSEILKSVIDKIYDLLEKAYEWIYTSGSRPNDRPNWGDVRNTALVALCLAIREKRGSQWRNAVKKWILDHQEKTGPKKGRGWGDEVWDTAFALVALKNLGTPLTDPNIEDALKWMIGLYDLNGRHNWHDEPWETSWAVLALCDFPSETRLGKMTDATKWLASLQDPSGKVVSTHYTAYFLMINHRMQTLGISTEDKNAFAGVARRAVSYLLGQLSKKTLWTGEAWSNGQILWALAMTNAFHLQRNSC